jgi:hypothetical protein
MKYMPFYLSTTVDKKLKTICQSACYINYKSCKSSPHPERSRRAGAEGLLLIRHPYHRHNHLFQTYTPVLKRIFIIIYKMVVIIGVT